LLLGYKPVQDVTVLNTVGNCTTMVPPSYMRSVVDRNVVMSHIPNTKSHVTRQRMTHVSEISWRLTAYKPWRGLQTLESKTRTDIRRSITAFEHPLVSPACSSDTMNINTEP
jgi:hypothetical protein